MTTGLPNVLMNLNKEIRKIEGRTKEGLFEAGIFIQGESMEVVPVKFGPLINSAFTNPPVERQRGPVVTVGYTQKYAPFVHEMPASFNYTKPGTGPKYLQKPISENHANILRIIQKRAMIP